MKNWRQAGLRGWLSGVAWGVCLCASLAADEAKSKVDFGRDIAPILASRCVVCHGGEQQEARLRLDVRERAFAGGDSGEVLAAGDSAASELFRRVASTDVDERMPPAEAGEPLSANEISLLKSWIDQGAEWPERWTTLSSGHWAFQPIRRPPPPSVADAAGVESPIDAFILARLEEENLKPSSEAGREALLRRLYLDLIGLVPTHDERAAFLLDTRPDAYERLVDRLLESPHFGERWGRHWLDLARYADSNGYELDVPRPNAWRYRDWVVDAVNRDLPYDQFIVEQMAGDLLEEASLSQAVATGFHRMTLKNDETGINEEDFRHREIVDRVNTTGTAILGLTVGCAECHSHKYDPISHAEYYQLYAFFERSAESDRAIVGSPQERAAFEAGVSAHYDEWVTTQIRERIVDGLLKKGPAKSRAAIEAAFQATQEQLDSQRLLLEVGVERWRKEAPSAVRNAIDAPSGIASLLKPSDEPFKPHMHRSLGIFIEALPVLNAALETRLASLERFAQELSADAAHVGALLVDEKDRAPEQVRLVTELFETLPSERDDLAASLKQMVHEEKYLPLPYVMVLEERPEDDRVTHVLLRGDFKRHGAVVEPLTPSFLPPIVSRGARPDRLDLANWIVSDSNPLTRRVAVNHIWAHLFGRGLVATADDFGIRGERPTHPELLDWLASEFDRLGWSRKRLIREIVLSSTYRRSSVLREDLASRDPLNTLLARQGRFRVEAEIVRDLFLSASGLLDRNLGGPTVYPPIPSSVRELAYKYKLHWPTSAAPTRFRRGMYIHLRRSNPFPSLVMFDGPEGTNCTAARNRSNTPLQALTTLNDPVFVENARSLARRALRSDAATDAERIDWMFAACLSRDPRPSERKVLEELIEAERLAAAQEPSAAALVGDYRLNEVPLDEQVAWAAAARTILNLDEFLTRE